MKPIPDLGHRLPAARAKDVFGTKMRSVIQGANAAGIARVVDQQFEIAREVIGHGLVPIIEPEIDIHAADKAACEDILRDRLLAGADALDDGLVMFKLTLPEQANFYADLCAHAKVLRVVALSGGYSREVANDRLAANNGMIASFSRALTEGLRVDLDATRVRQLARPVHSQHRGGLEYLTVSRWRDVRMPSSVPAVGTRCTAMRCWGALRIRPGLWRSAMPTPVALGCPWTLRAPGRTSRLAATVRTTSTLCSRSGAHRR